MLPINPHDPAAVETIVPDLERMVASEINRRLPFLSEHDAQDMQQSVLLSLLRTSIRRYDPSRGVRLSTFLYKCISSAVSEQIRFMTRKKRRAMSPLPDGDAEDCIDPRGGAGADYTIETLADRITTCPESLFPPHRARIVRALIEHPQATAAELGRLLGLSAGAIATARYRIRKEIRAMAMVN